MAFRYTKQQNWPICVRTNVNLCIAWVAFSALVERALVGHPLSRVSHDLALYFQLFWSLCALCRRLLFICTELWLHNTVLIVISHLCTVL